MVNLRGSDDYLQGLPIKPVGGSTHALREWWGGLPQQRFGAVQRNWNKEIRTLMTCLLQGWESAWMLLVILSGFAISMVS